MCTQIYIMHMLNYIYTNKHTDIHIYRQVTSPHSVTHSQQTNMATVTWMQLQCTKY